MIKNLWNKYIEVIAFDLLRAKRFDHENSIVDAYDFKIHNFMFTTVLVFSFLFLIDAQFCGSNLSKIFIHILSADVDIDNLSNRQYFRILFAEASILSIVVGVFSAIYFYIKFGGDFNRSMLYSKPSINFALNYLGNLVGAMIGVAIGVFGGFLVAIKFFEALSLDALPIFIVLQVIIVAKTLSFATPSTCRFFQIIMPYSLHPK